MTAFSAGYLPKLQRESCDLRANSPYSNADGVRGPINYLTLLYRRVSMAGGSGWRAAGRLIVEGTGKLLLELAARYFIYANAKISLI
ncbi:hypothetical protein SO3561_06385 [Streptomyces olivochromogenes]|uniref:Uncharacterized protein n=1 Tax=Streptomyces olivochromogenes TaxID=1963 RepID=A0A250VL98_STROL|nr:hypothetical protein SO3561_06385 [Streptomyces olivochromogenes]